ncbi:hypothetical protein CUN61_06740 [Pseudomonas arsenicoxydans]|uniref:Uncharacterized protein n=1 Tax=Pseudomonas arsenicoxydans TaxID=702115 RepID=A0A4P6G2Z5_9PSED|nr:hypothetical protein CUN61_06740 [Pseudomonas arsenicoxydans]
MNRRASSRAGSLPQGNAVNCGSEPARDGARPGNTCLESPTQILEYHYQPFLPHCHMTDALHP